MATLDAPTRAFLAEKRFAVLATINASGSIQQTVMWYDLEGDEILMNTLVGRVKDGNLRRNPHVSICIEDGYRFVTLSGTVCLIEDQPTAQADIRRLALRYAKDPATIDADAEHFTHETRVTLRMTLEKIMTRF